MYTSLGHSPSFSEIHLERDFSTLRYFTLFIVCTSALYCILHTKHFIRLFLYGYQYYYPLKVCEQLLWLFSPTGTYLSCNYNQLLKYLLKVFDYFTYNILDISVKIGRDYNEIIIH